MVQQRRSFRSLSADKPEIEEIRHPFAVIVSQDCDLEQDFECRTGVPQSEKADDTRIPNVLLAEAVTVRELVESLAPGKDIRKLVFANRHERYHVFEEVHASGDAQGVGLPALGIDFKRYFTIPTDELYAQLKGSKKRRCHLNNPYLEHFGKRFVDFLSRIALPRQHRVER